MSTEAPGAPGAPGAPAARRLLRDRSGGNQVTNIELFFDLVYVFAVTQLSHNLVQYPTVSSALQSALLLAMVWLAWAYTTWVTNWMDPERIEVRLLLVVLALLSLAMSAALPRAFTGPQGIGGLGWVVGTSYAVQQVGRSVFMVVALRGPLQRNFERILAWCAVSGALAVAAFVVSFAGSVALWWLYFDRSAGASAEVIESSDDPGRIARSAYHLVHPLMVAGIIVTAAGDEKILTSPSSSAPASSAWMILGGPALFLAGHAAFKFVVWRTVPWTRLAGIAVLALLALAVPVLPEIALAACAAAVVAVVAALDRVTTRPRQSP